MPFRDFKNKLLLAACAVLFFCTAITLLPEPVAKISTSSDEWQFGDVVPARVAISSIPVQTQHVRESVIASVNSSIFRSWKPDEGDVAFELTSPPFTPSRYMAIPITGFESDSVNAVIECETNQSQIKIFNGGVNNQLIEALVAVPEGWCQSYARLKLESREPGHYVGIGAPYEISTLSYLKSGFAGRLPYLLMALAIFSLIMFAGAALGAKLKPGLEALPLAVVSLAGLSLVMFYWMHAMLLLPHGWRWLAAFCIGLLIALFLWMAGRDSRRMAIETLRPYLVVWWLLTIVYFAISALTYNGLGHWEPNFRFWPAAWSSDNELPWLYAEAIRNGWDLRGLFGGGWLPSDRPPLMTGAHLLLSDVFSFMQSNNDGNYLRGGAYNASALALNALWAPVIWWLLVKYSPAVDFRGRVAVMVLIAALPFVLFNTVYGWPKFFGAAIALTAFGMAWQVNQPTGHSSQNVMIFFVLCALSMLAHASTFLFLAPLALVFLVLGFRRHPQAMIAGIFAGLFIMASWSLYKLAILPSADPVTKYALTGDYGFGREASLLQMLQARYADMSFMQWLDIKQKMLLQVFWPVHHDVAQIDLLTGLSAPLIDKLRAWDFLMLSAGNIAVLVFMVASVTLLVRMAGSGSFLNLKQSGIYYGLLGLSVVAWLTMVLFFFAPTVIHHWPQAALLGMALGGASICMRQQPRLFAVLLVMTLAYTSLVWIISPLQTALSIDWGAALLLAVLLSWLGMSVIMRGSSTPHVVEPPPIAMPVDEVGGDMAGKIVDKIKYFANLRLWFLLTPCLALAGLVFSAYFAITYADQPLVDAHAFRQTQTAITAYWMQIEGWKLAYQTPIAGYPWSIPFEFPIYQTIVATFSTLSGLELDVTGRLVSYAFLVACSWPVLQLCRRLGLPLNVFWVFCALLWTAPLNVYWGRTFMIETTALFFSMACLPYAVDLVRSQNGYRSILFFILFATAAVLQKSTTGGPVLLFLAMATIIVQLHHTGTSQQSVRLLILPLLIMAIPLAIGLAWAGYADTVKLANPFGAQLTSASLRLWNFGTLDQRLSLETWRLIVWERSAGWNAAGLPGLLLIAASLSFRARQGFSIWILSALALFLLPVLVFTNLHFVHEYYQVANLAFLLAALAIVVGGWLPVVSSMKVLVPSVTSLIMLANLLQFNSAYGIVIKRLVDQQDPRTVQAYRVGQYLRQHTPDNTALAIFGQAYSSEIAYHAQRKSMTVPDWFSEYREFWKQPQKYLGEVPLSAIVLCPSADSFPTAADLRDKVADEGNWQHIVVEGCELLLKVHSSE